MALPKVKTKSTTTKVIVAGLFIGFFVLLGLWIGFLHNYVNPTGVWDCSDAHFKADGKQYSYCANTNDPNRVFECIVTWANGYRTVSDCTPVNS